MANSKKEPPRGVLNREKGSVNFGVSRYHPSPALENFIEHFWIVRWDLRGKEPYRQDVLSHPSVHLVFEKDSTRIWGVVTGKFTRVLKEKGQVLGVKFQPSGFYPFFNKPVASISDKQIPFQKVFDEDIEFLEKNILSHEEDEMMVKKAEEFLHRHLPDRDPRAEEVAQIVKHIMEESSILKVDDLADYSGHSKRTLQRLFRTYVGATPKWVIQRYRLHEAAEKMAAGTDNWPALAADLGYFDQAHFIRDFKGIVGQTPAEYVKNL
ncbi:MAG: DUF6597 domain-containing transcriptional factor [Balneolaceae bacterium]